MPLFEALWKFHFKKILSTEGFFRKSTFCTLTEAKPGFDGHWVMPEIFLLNGTFTMLEMTAFLLNTFFNSMHWCKSATLKIANLAILNHYMVLLNQCMELKKVFNKKLSFQALWKCHLVKIFLAWPSVRQIQDLRPPKYKMWIF